MLDRTFEAKLSRVSTWIILKLPESASAILPSRGQVVVEGTLNGVSFQAPLEPDGAGGHWLNVSDTLREAAEVDAGETVTLMMRPVKFWPEPQMPEDFKQALADDPHAHAL